MSIANNFWLWTAGTILFTAVGSPIFSQTQYPTLTEQVQRLKDGRVEVQSSIDKFKLIPPPTGEPQSVHRAQESDFATANPYTVTSTLNSGVGTLRQAITDANSNAGPDVIAFSIGGGGFQSIAPTSALPTITGPVMIDGTTQPGYAGTPLIEINGAGAGANVNGLYITGGGSIVKGLLINRFIASGIYNGHGIVCDIAGGNVIQSNYIGTNAAGTASLQNGGSAILLAGNSIRNLIGGSVTSQANLLSGNFGNGVQITPGNAGQNAVRGNYIGLDVSGLNALPNGGNGVYVVASNDTIGGTGVNDGNYISGNLSPGIALLSGSPYFTTSNLVQGNYVGTDVTGINAIGNTVGININNAPNNIIGGTAVGARNVISGNSNVGIVIGNAAALGNKVSGNYIGVDAAGAQILPNLEGVFIYSNAANNIIGGTTLAERNVIAGSFLRGVEVQSGTGNTIRMNKIYSSSGLGIDLAALGLTPNDSLDGDTGANNRQNFPLLDSARVAGAYTIINGRFNSAPNAAFTIDFYSNANYHPSHFGEGEIHIGSTTLNTNAAGNDSIRVTLPVAVSSDRYITATATDAAGNTSEFSQALCLADQDSDGIMDSWETSGWGIDHNSDGVIDLDLYALGARKDHKDIFVEVDAMIGFVPELGVLNNVVTAFANAPDSLVRNPDHADGVKLHYVLDDTMIAVKHLANVWPQFDTIKTAYWGTETERTTPNGRYTLEAKNLVYRYCLFARGFTMTLGGADSGYSGLGELEYGMGGNDFIVSLGADGWAGNASFNDRAGTFMHEMGHTFGLHHGGGDDINYKPNYISVMSYTWQNPSSWLVPGSWKLDYSPAALDPLNESSLNEPVGLDPTPGTYRVIPVPFTFYDGTYLYTRWARLRPGIATDWDDDGDSTEIGSQGDLNGLANTLSPGETLVGHADWSNIKYNFRNSPAFKKGVRTQSRILDAPQQELDWNTFQILNNLPPPKPVGQFIMDGQLDGSATLLVSNGGVNLYAAISGTQLYVATNSAQSQAADMFIYVAAPPGVLQNPPALKSGQVAAWLAVLGNESSNNSSQWYDASASPLNTISIDTAGTVLEGVIDVEFLLGAQPTDVQLAVGRYQTNDGGALTGQSPSGNGNGNIEASEFYSFSTPLPVQLASFTANVVAAGDVRLDWTTVSEVNNYGFEVERKANGQPVFLTIENSFIPGHGTTIEPHTYMFTDTTAMPGRLTYRLKQIDLDGTLHFSSDVIVDVLTGTKENLLPTTFAMHPNYPNPFNPSTQIKYDLPEPAKVSLVVYDVVGRKVAELVNSTREAGYHSATWNASDMASGVYYARLVAKDGRDNEKLNKVIKLLLMK